MQLTAIQNIATSSKITLFDENRLDPHSILPTHQQNLHIIIKLGAVAKPQKFRGRLRIYRRRPRRRPDGIRNLKFGYNGRLAQQLCLREVQHDRDGMRRFFLDSEDAVGTFRRQFCNSPYGSP